MHRYDTYIIVTYNDNNDSNNNGYNNNDNDNHTPCFNYIM